MFRRVSAVFRKYSVRFSPFFFPIVYFSLAFLITGNVLWYHQKIASQTPDGSMYSYAYGHIPDFYQYVSIIRSGRDGNLLFNNQYSEVPFPAFILHPFLHLTGYISRPFPVSPNLVLFVTRVIAQLLLYTCVFFLIRRVFTSLSTRLLATVLFFFSNNFWSVAWTNGQLTIVNPQLFSDYFSISERILRIPPHHMFALSGCIVLILLLTRPQTSAGVVFAFILSASVALLHPYIAYLLCIFTICVLGIRISTTRSITKQDAPFVAALVAGIATLLYTMLYIGFILPQAGSSSGILVWAPRDIPFFTYVQGLGLCIFVAPFIFMTSHLRRPIVQYLAIWAFVPVGMFFLADFRIPVQINRLFQINQQVPLALLSALAVHDIVNKMRYRKVIIGILSVIVLLYGLVPLVIQESRDITSVNLASIPIYIPATVTRAFSYLLHYTKPGSVVLAGETMSLMTPAFTRNRVIIGHQGDTPNYTNTLREVIAFFSGTMTEEEIRTFLQAHNIEYIIFDIDAPVFSVWPGNTLPQFQQVYSDGTVTVVRVTPF